MRLVHEESVHAQFLEGQRVVFLFVRRQFLEFRFQSFLRPFEGLHDARVAPLALLLDGQGQFAHLSLEELLLRRLRNRDLLKPGMGHDDCIPVARGDAAHQCPPFLLLKIVLCGDQNVRSGIKREQFRGKLAQHVVGHNE